MSRRPDRFNRAEFLRFFMSGLTAAVANLSAVYAVRQVAPLSAAILFGFAAGFLVSFLLSKYFAFEARRSGQSAAELRTFTLVFAFGCLCYWLVAMLGTELLRPFMRPAHAEALATLTGAVTMILTSYFGHRFFTFRSAAREAARND